MTKTKEQAAFKRSKTYAALDGARFFCAFLVVAIHIRPLSDITGLGSFLLDKGLCRIAVPFFFLVSGYFYGRKPPEASSLVAFLRRTALLYGMWTIIYYPIAAESQDMTHYWRRCLFTGSYYHLWYYPALMTAAALTWLGLKALKSEKAVVFLSFVFYIIGCMGESYYGLFAQIPQFEALAEWYFSLFWSTRSGLFFGFFFFALGVFFQKKGWSMNQRRAAAAFFVSLGLMLLEILFLDRLGIARDYNMYLGLVFASVFLFFLLLGEPEKAQKKKQSAGIFFRRCSVLIYGIHLWFLYYGNKYAMLISEGEAFFGAEAGLLAAAELFLSDSLIRYLMLCAASMLFSAAVLALQRLWPLRWLKYLY